MDEVSDSLAHIRCVLCDLDGTLYVGDDVVEGAASALKFLNERGIAVRYLTNTTTRSRDSVHAHAVSLGLPVQPDEIMSASYAGVLHLRAGGSPRCRLLLNEDARRDYAEFVVDEENPEVIVIGDIGDAWDYELMNGIFRQILNGARLVALHKNRYYQSSDGLALDVGAFCAAIEYGSGEEAAVVGKPAERFFRLAVDELGVEAERIAVVGDDIDNDVGAAQRLGMAGVLVKTGKYRTELARESQTVPNFVLESVKYLPELF